MDDLRQKVYNVLEAPQLAGLATVTEDGLPWVRRVVIRADNDLNLRLATFAGSRKVAQIRANPEVHLVCGVSSLATMAPYLQIQGRAEVATDHDERHAFWTDQLGTYFSGPDDPNLAIVIIKPYRIEYMAVGSMEPEVLDLL